MRTSSSARRARDAERRQLTVLVCGCDTFESEPYLELDSEEQANVLRSFLDTCEKAVDRFGGTIVECSEKGVVACFGFPLAYEDAAGRAARTGLAIVEGMKIPAWVGIHTGAAVVESKGGAVSLAGAVSLVGEARNVAVRLEDVAVAGQVISTEASHHLFQGRFQCASLGRQKIKGAALPVERSPGTVSLVKSDEIRDLGARTLEDVLRLLDYSSTLFTLDERRAEELRKAGARMTPLRMSFRPMRISSPT
jgi:class 3 adenylate cyclase